MRISSANLDKMEKPRQQAYVRLEHEESVTAKKNILSIEMNLLQILTKIGEYKKFRKQEIRDRIELKKKLRTIKTESIEFMERVPEVEKPKLKIKRNSSGGKEVKQKKEANFQKGVEQQLAEIKERLQKLDQG